MAANTFKFLPLAARSQFEEAWAGLPALLLEHGQTLGAIPLALRLVGQVHAPEVKPLDGTILVVATNHLTVRNLQLKSSMNESAK